MELRQFLKAQPGADRLRIFEEAVDSGDAEIYAAFAESHKIFNLLGEDILAAGREKLLRKKDPLLANAFFGCERAGSILAENFEHVINDLAAYAPIDPCQYQKLLSDIPRPDWQHKSDIGRFMDNSDLSTVLPKPTTEFKK
jgi:hypothetical protein